MIAYTILSAIDPDDPAYWQRVDAAMALQEHGYPVETPAMIMAPDVDRMIAAALMPPRL